MKYKLIKCYTSMLNKLIDMLTYMREYADPTIEPVREGAFGALFGNIDKINDESVFEKKITKQ